jgi:chromosome segregation ATPase
MTDMAKKSPESTRMPDSLKEAREIVTDLREIVREQHEELEGLQAEHKKELDALRKELGTTEDSDNDLIRQAEDARDIAEDSKKELQLDFRAIMKKFGGHQNCLEGAVIGQALNRHCTCGWNEHATYLERL